MDALLTRLTRSSSMGSPISTSPAAVVARGRYRDAADEVPIALAPRVLYLVGAAGSGKWAVFSCGRYEDHMKPRSGPDPNCQ
jgi:hypothetical protein